MKKNTRNKIAKSVFLKLKTQKIPPVFETCQCGRQFKTRGGFETSKEMYIFRVITEKMFPKSYRFKNVSNVSLPSNTEPIIVEDELKQLQLQKQLEVEKLKKEIENINKPQTSTNSITNELVETIEK